MADQGSDVLNWSWPASPGVFKLHDKYADKDVILLAGEEVWVFSVGGRNYEHRFAPQPARELQQKLIMLTHVKHAPASVQKFTTSLIRNWKLYLKLLEEGPSRVQETWEMFVTDVDVAKAGKTILRLAADSSLGPWRESHRELIKGLDARAQEAEAEHHRRIRKRELLVPVAKQAELVRVLDLRALEPDLTERQAEGLASLAFAFQHGVRPVQQIALKLEHVHTYVDAAGDPICLVSFHQAKQQTGNTADGEMLRQVKSEWVGPVLLLVEFAKKTGRTRLFRSTTSEELWDGVKRVCAEAGVKVNFTSNKLRHSSAQALADAGHSRRSIQWFLGHSTLSAAISYLKASRYQGSLINAALGASKLYDNMASMAFGEFVSVEDLRQTDDAQQIGGIIGDRLIAGIGLCRSKQSACSFDPVISCYGCHKYIPALNPPAHLEAIAGMREQVIVFIKKGEAASPAYLQMMRALAGAQHALADCRRILGAAHG
ncbi:tyrosine-type recombinase/integrase [Ralstonia nicotianae]